jgi:hypothetical protein
MKRLILITWILLSLVLSSFSQGDKNSVLITAGLPSIGARYERVIFQPEEGVKLKVSTGYRFRNIIQWDNDGNSNEVHLGLNAVIIGDFIGIDLEFGGFTPIGYSPINNSSLFEPIEGPIDIFPQFKGSVLYDSKEYGYVMKVGVGYPEVAHASIGYNF